MVKIIVPAMVLAACSVPVVSTPKYWKDVNDKDLIPRTEMCVALGGQLKFCECLFWNIYDRYSPDEITRAGAADDKKLVDEIGSIIEGCEHALNVDEKNSSRR